MAKPLIPVCIAAYVFMAMLSPLSWGNHGLNYLIVITGIMLGIVSAYCIAAFVLIVKS